MNVLSLFDGMSCGQIALQRAGITYDNYFASEVDKHAIKVTQHNFPNTIQLGDVTKVKGSDLPRIDLLIGGSPCQGFSFAGRQLNFDDPRSKLFFEYVRLLNETKPQYFLLENVRMKKESMDVISDILDVEPILINSSLVSAQNRRRLYWTNIPNVTQPDDRGILLRDILQLDIIGGLTDEYIQHKLNQRRWGNNFGTVEREKSSTLVAMGKSDVILLTDLKRYLTPTECERLQTVPDNYTSIVANSHRYKMLGNGWTVDVIVHIFKHLFDFAIARKNLEG